jgi:CheY-like chemotaxis protein
VLRLLFVEDNPADARLFAEAFKGTDTEVRSVEDGESALNYLRRKEPFENAQRPDLLIIDLNLPRMNGQELIAEVKKQKDLARIPVVVFTSSPRPQDREECERLGVNAYVVKPVDARTYMDKARLMLTVQYTGGPGTDSK